MSRGKNYKLILLYVLSISFISVSLITFLLVRYYSHMQFQLLGDFCEEIIEKYPDSKQAILEVLKSKKAYSVIDADENILSSFGYSQSDFCDINGQIFMLAATGFLAGNVLFFCAFLYWQKKNGSQNKNINRVFRKSKHRCSGIAFGYIRR